MKKQRPALGIGGHLFWCGVTLWLMFGVGIGAVTVYQNITEPTTEQTQ